MTQSLINEGKFDIKFSSDTVSCRFYQIEENDLLSIVEYFDINLDLLPKTPLRKCQGVMTMGSFIVAILISVLFEIGIGTGVFSPAISLIMMISSIIWVFVSFSVIYFLYKNMREKLISHNFPIKGNEEHQEEEGIVQLE